jgi:hypothetical protein
MRRLHLNVLRVSLRGIVMEERLTNKRIISGSKKRFSLFAYGNH